MLKEVKGRQGILALLGVDEQDWLDWTGLDWAWMSLGFCHDGAGGLSDSLLNHFRL